MLPGIIPTVSRRFFLGWEIFLLQGHYSHTHRSTPPSERLLALHSAIGHILYLSGAGGYIDRILDDIENGSVLENGSTQLGVLVYLALRIKALS